MKVVGGIGSRLTPGTVIATIALVAALGGGYAAAFSGSGSLKKAAINGPGSSFQDARSLPGFGTLQVRCDSEFNQIVYRLKNASKKDLQIREFNDVTGQNHNDTVFAAETFSTTFHSGSNLGSGELHIWKSEEGNKTQVDIRVGNHGPISGDCSRAEVRILALSTRE